MVWQKCRSTGCLLCWYWANWCSWMLLYRQNIVSLYNQYVGAIEKLDMMCLLYKPTLRLRRWYIFLCLHLFTIAVVNAWFLHRRNRQLIDPQENHCLYVSFKQTLQVVWLVLKKALEVDLLQSLNWIHYRLN